MMRGGLRVIILSSLVWGNFLSATSGQESSQPGLSAQIGQLVEEIKESQDGMVRNQLSQRLTSLIRRGNNSDVTDTAIDQIASLLADDDDRIRNWMANALSYIGPPARRAVPALEQALKRRLADRKAHPSPYPLVGLDSTVTICLAFNEIGTTPPESECAR